MTKKERACHTRFPLPLLPPGPGGVHGALSAGPQRSSPNLGAEDMVLLAHHHSGVEPAGRLLYEQAVLHL